MYTKYILHQASEHKQSLNSLPIHIAEFGGKIRVTE